MLKVVYNALDQEIPEDTTKRWDYVSKALTKVKPDALFPHKVAGNPNVNDWEYLRREVPHIWHVDERFPRMGFLSRDEASIVHNLAKLFKGKKALEIGCWRGWSTAHILKAGVELDVVDIVLEDPDALAELQTIAKGCGASKRTRFFAGSSHLKVPQIAEEDNKKWSFFFIDGDHEVPAPARDAVLCSQFAEKDALMVFHDLASPHVSDALVAMRREGWNTMVYQTMQIMGIAWRGKIKPVPHTPDPQVNWELPDHLASFRLAHETSTQYQKRLVELVDDLTYQKRAFDTLLGEYSRARAMVGDWQRAFNASLAAAEAEGGNADAGRSKKLFRR